MKTDLVRSLALVSIVGLGACSSATEPIREAPEVPKFTCTANSATMRLPVELRATLPTFGPREPDDLFVSVSRTVPGGFAGLFWENGTSILTFVDPAAANTARAEIQRALENHSGHPYLNLDVADAEFRAARWTFVELDEWYRHIITKGAIFAHGAGSSDMDERANTIRLTAPDEQSRSRLEAHLGTLGISCNLVTTEIQPIPSLAG